MYGDPKEPAGQGVVSLVPREREEYPRPPIEEAFCQLVFAEPLPWNVATPGVLYEVLKDAYPAAPEAQDEVEASFEVGPEKVSASSFAINRGRQRIIFKTADGTRLIVVDSSSISVNSLRPYEGWPFLRDRLRAAVDSLAQRLTRPPVAQINLRYINRIKVPQALINSDDYFQVQVRTAEAGRANFSAFLQRVESVLTDRVTQAISTFATLESPPGEAHFLLDLDFRRGGLQLTSVDEVIGVANSLKDAENEEFESWLTEQSRALFR